MDNQDPKDIKKSKWLRRGKITAVVLLLVFVLVRLLTSSYAFCNWYLPLASRSLGFRISADEVKFTPFSSKKHLNFRGLQVELKDRAIFSAKSFKTKISFFDLIFRNLYSLDNIQVERASMVISDLQQTVQTDETTGLERLRIGTLSAKNFSVRYAPRDSAVFCDAYIDELYADSMLPDRENTIRFQTLLAWDMPDSNMVNLPLMGSVRFNLDQELYPRSLHVEIESDKINGKIYEQDLSRLHLKTKLVCHRDTGNHMVIDQFLFQQFDESRETFRFAADGDYDLAAKKGRIQVSAQAKRLSLSLLTTDFIPENLDMTFNGFLSKDENRLSLAAKLHLTADAIKRDNKLILPEPEITLATNLSWDIAADQLHFNECRIEAASQKKQWLAAETTGPFSLCKNHDGSWDVSNQKTAAFKLKLQQLPISILNNVVPFQFSNGTISADYELRINPAAKRIEGSFSGSAADVEMTYADAPLFKKHTVKFNCSFYSKGLQQISQLVIPELTICLGEPCFSRFTMSGRALLQQQVIELKGNLQTTPLPLLQHIQLHPVQQFCNFMKKLSATPGKNDFLLDLRFAPKKGELSFTAVSHLNNLPLPGSDKHTDLTFQCSGNAIFGEKQRISLDNFSLSAPGGLDLCGSANAEFPAGIYQAKFILNHASADFLRGMILMGAMKQETQKNWLRKMYHKGLSATADLTVREKDRSFAVSNVSLTVNHGAESYAKITMDAPVTGKLAPFSIDDSAGKAVFVNFPMEYANTLTEDTCRLDIQPGKINCSVNFKICDQLARWPFSASGSVDSLAVIDNGETLYKFGKCTFRGNAELYQFFSGIKYENAEWILEQNGGKQIVTGHGELIFNYPFTNEIFLNLDHFDRKYFAAFFPVASGLIRLQEADIITRIHVLCLNDYDEVKVNLDQDFKKIIPVFPEQCPDTVPVIHGTGHLTYTYNTAEAGRLTLNKSGIELFDQHNKRIFHAEIQGEWNRKHGNNSHCFLRSDVADGRIAYLALKAAENGKWNGNPADDSTEEPPKNGVTFMEQQADAAFNAVISTISGSNEPAAIDLDNFSTLLRVQIKNWTYTPNLNFSLNGSFKVQNNIFQAKELSGKLNGAKFLLDAFADLGKKDGWEMEMKWKLENLDLVPLVATFGSEELKAKKPTGMIDHLNLIIKTKGITIENLDKNLQVNAEAAISNLSFPLQSDEEKSALQIILMPVSILPRLYDLIPEKAGRKRIQKILGGAHVDILSGKKNVDLERGFLKIQNAPQRHTDLIASKLLFKGPIVQIAAKHLRINPFHNELDAMILTRFGGITYPLKAVGTIREANIDYSAAVVAMLRNVFTTNPFSSDNSGLWEFDQPAPNPGENNGKTEK